MERKLSYLPGEIRRSTEGNGNHRYTLKAVLILRKSAEAVVAGKPKGGCGEGPNQYES